MHFAIDVREACRTPLTGKGRWTVGFVNALHERGEHLTLFSDQTLPDDLAQKWSDLEFTIIHQRGLRWHLRAAKMFLQDSTLDVYVSTVSYLVPCFLRGRKPSVTIVHDLIAFRPEPHDKRASFIEHVSLQIAARHTSLLCTVSDTTKKDLIKKFPFTSEKTVAIYAGCDKPIASHPTNGDGPIVSIGTLCPRKNQLRLIQAHQRLPEQLRAKHPLILIGGRGWADEEIITAAQKTSHVQWMQRVSDAERDVILKDAVLCAFPSLYEGFGLPVLEAFCAGIPVVTSHGGSLAEVANDAAYIVDPLDKQSIADGLRTMIENPAMRQAYAEKGLKHARMYSWKKTADLFLKAVSYVDR